MLRNRLNHTVKSMIDNPSFVNKSTERSGVIADIIAEMDYRVGQVLDAIKEGGIDDNTIVILSSDNANGGAIPQAGTGLNGPWRGGFCRCSLRWTGYRRWPGWWARRISCRRIGRSTARRSCSARAMRPAAIAT